MRDGWDFLDANGGPASPLPHGYLDAADCTNIRGWALDRSQPGSRVTVEVYDGTNLIGTTMANQFRQDLRDLHLGDGSGTYGFSLPTPANLKNGVAHTIKAKIASTNFFLGNTKIFNSLCGSTPTAKIKLFGGGQIGGNNQVLTFAVQVGQKIKMTFDGATSQATNTALRFWNWTRRVTGLRNQDGSISTTTVTSTNNLPKFDEDLGPGTHTVDLEVVDAAGLRDTATATIIINETSEPKPVPFISMTGGSQTGTNGQTLNYTVAPGGSINMSFSASNSQPGSGSITAYEWRSNGTVINSTSNFNFPFAAASHTITLKITNSAGLSNTATAGIVVTTVSSPTPTINDITTSPNPPVGGQAFNFTITGTNFISNTEVFFRGPGCPNNTSCVVSGLNRTSTQLSGAAVLAPGSFTVQARNGSAGTPSNTSPFNVSTTPPAPVINQLTTSPSPPINGQAFTITLTGTNFSGTNSTIFFSGPGCSTPCSISATGSSTQVSGQAILAAGNFTVTVRNNVTGLTSGGVPLTVSNPTPVINQLTTSPSPPINGQAFTITLTGTNFSGTNSTIFFSGPGCSTPCSISATGSSTQVSGQAILATGSFTVTVRNNVTGLTSGSVPLTVSNPAPVINQLTTSPSPPINGQAFTITLTGTNFSGTNSTIFFSGPGCSTPCSISATGSSTQVSGQAILAAGNFTVTVRNNVTGLTSGGVPLTVSNPTPVINQLTTSPSPPINGQAFTITLTGTNFSGTNSTIFFSGPGCSTPCSISATGSSTQVSGQAILATGSFTVTVRNNVTGFTSGSVPLTVSNGVPTITGMTRSPNPPVHGQPFNFTITGTNYNTSNAQVFFLGPGCPTSTSCVVTSLTRTSTQLSGAAVLAAGSFTVQVRNGPTGTPSNTFPFSVN